MYTNIKNKTCNAAGPERVAEGGAEGSFEFGGPRVSKISLFKKLKATAVPFFVFWEARHFPTPFSYLRGLLTTVRRRLQH
jgi:hypothetical protein